MGAELKIADQIKWLDSILFFDKEKCLACNPFIGISTEALLLEIRKSLVRLQDIEK